MIYADHDEALRLWTSAFGEIYRVTNQFSRVGTAATALFIALCLFHQQAYATPSEVEAVPITSPQERCQELGKVDFSHVDDAPTHIASTSYVEGHGSDGAYCKVQGYTWPQINFEVRLPANNWTGRFIEIGCGGSCGTLNWSFWCPTHRGYACIVSDMGHRSEGNDSFIWARDNPGAQIDYNIRGPHVGAVIGKSIIAAFYRRSANWSYFLGCSNGGTQALSEVQRFPHDFNGIVSLSGAPRETDTFVEILWAARALRGGVANNPPILGSRELQLLHQTALKLCDLDDRVTDGIISRPMQCHIDPHTLICGSKQKSGCLTPEAADAAIKIYTGPTDENGAKGSFIGGMLPGSELGWTGAEGFVEENDHSGSDPTGAEDFFRNFAPQPYSGDLHPHALNFNEDLWRAGIAESLVGASNPDLRKFRDAGGKLLQVHGWNDQSIPATLPIDYYEMVTQTMGGKEATRKFARLFVVPGMTHCTGGDGAFAIDYLTYMENWVERGSAPSELIGAHVSDDYLLKIGESARASLESQGNNFDSDALDRTVKWDAAMSLRFPLNSSVPVDFTRPIYEYPTVAEYVGHGQANSARSFRRSDPKGARRP